MRKPKIKIEVERIISQLGLSKNPVSAESGAQGSSVPQKPGEVDELKAEKKL